ncbi:unnamed protein product [Ectocarpus sp. 4 AP-2014]
MEGSNNRSPGATSNVPSTPRACRTPEATRTHVDLTRRARGRRSATTIVPHSNEGSCPRRDIPHQGVVEAATPLVDGGVDSDVSADRPGHGCGPGHGLTGVPAAVSTNRSAVTAETGEDYGRLGITTSARASSETASHPYFARTGTAECSNSAPFTRSISSRNRRAASMSSTRLVVPYARGLELESLIPRTLSARASTSSLSTPLPGAGSADTPRRRDSERDSWSSSSSQQQQPPQQDRQNHPTAYPLRVPNRHGRSDGGRASIRRLAGGGRDAWRTSAGAYSAVVRGTGRDTTALRAVSARLDAASTAIDAVEIGVRSASDSLDSLLHLLESRHGPAVSQTSLSSTSAEVDAFENGSAGPAPSSRGIGEGGRVAASSGSQASADAMSMRSSRSSILPPAMSLPTSSGLMVGTSSSESRPNELSVSTPPSQPIGPPGYANRDGAPIVARVQEGGGGSRAASMLRREQQAGLPAFSNPEAGEHLCRSTAVLPRQDGEAQESSVAIGDTSIGETNEEHSSRTRSGQHLTSALTLPRPVSSPAAQELVEEVNSSRRTAERETSESHGLGMAGSATAGQHLPADIGIGGTMEAAPTDLAALRTLGSDRTPSLNSGPRLVREAVSRRVPPRGMEETGSGAASSTREANAAETSGRGDVALPVGELEAAMNGIDTERGRLILEIARLRGQQNQSLVHLHRLQHEQFVVRQRQVSTLSDIVNSFGRTVAAAGALPHGEDSSLGRISSDVVSTLRRMLRLLSATVPAVTTAQSAPGNSPVLTTTSSVPDGAPPPAPNTPRPAAVREGQAANGSAGTYSAGGRVAPRPAGVDLTQEVIDAALQALPRLAAAATAISGASRMQGYLADLAGGGASDTAGRGSDYTGRCCSKETIAALPDASHPVEGAVGEDDGGGVRGCVICLSENDMAGQHLCRLPCNHVFHRVCVGKWLSMQDSCPTCRRQVPNVEIGSALATTAPNHEVA